MLEKPELADDRIILCLNNEYGIPAAQATFLPLGADRNAAAYRIVADDGTPYFLKLRQGHFEPISVALPRFLREQGIRQIIAPLMTTAGQLWTGLDAFTAILYPFVDGLNGFEVRLSDRHWREFGAVLKRIHTVDLPPLLGSDIPSESYTPHWRLVARRFLERVEDEPFDEPVAARLVAFLRVKRDIILDLVERTEQLAQPLQVRPPESVLCHSDIHAGNVLIGADDAFYIVDWDEPIFAPKERDLMYAGGAQGFIGYTAEEEEALFYKGYGQTEIDPRALAYYRYERIVQDIAIFCEQILLTDEGGQDREQSFRYLASNFLPDNTIELAYKSDKT